MEALKIAAAVRSLITTNEEAKVIAESGLKITGYPVCSTDPILAKNGAKKYTFNTKTGEGKVGDYFLCSEWFNNPTSIKKVEEIAKLLGKEMPVIAEPERKGTVYGKGSKEAEINMLKEALEYATEDDKAVIEAKIAELYKEEPKVKKVVDAELKRLMAIKEKLVKNGLSTAKIDNDILKRKEEIIAKVV